MKVKNAQMTWIFHVGRAKISYMNILFLGSLWPQNMAANFYTCG